MFSISSELTQISIYIFILQLTFLLYNPITAQELVKGFTATPDSSVALFQPLLNDSVGNYSFGFLRVDRTQLVIAVIHVASKEPIWITGKSPVTRWSSKTSLLFNGSLVIMDKQVGVLWSSYTDGERVWLSYTSNLIIDRVDDIGNQRSLTLWQSFDFPYNTLMENQNFTSDMTLVSSNGLYLMRLGPDFIGFYTKYGVDPSSDSDPSRLYFKHNPMEAKAQIKKGGGPIRVMLNPDGYIAMYQNGIDPVDVQPFSSFQQPGTGNRRVTLEPDGNLVGYYWTKSSWVVDFKEISSQCDLPSSCGPYGLCQPGKGCSCLNKHTNYTSGRCDIGETRTLNNDFCNEKYDVLRRTGIELPNKEVMNYTIMSSLKQCENACEEKCPCWGAVYSNTSGFCYTINYPIQTLVEVLDETKMGYFKMRHGVKDTRLVGLWVGLGLLCGLVLLLLIVGGVYLYKRKSRGVMGYVEEKGVNGGGVGPYKNLESSSFKSIELSER
ncbi:PAN domain-containing protein At5g03700-like [Rutidosis leptorrhynchoides]|uniref:PAN domain-containing protein At5g03700-like n=1 Tax=Rutidosis leptorrhynchoides TaxID=125765 RepID=UPI003A9A662E